VEKFFKKNGIDVNKKYVKRKKEKTPKKQKADKNQQVK
jgi:hypothetical protein